MITTNKKISIVFLQGVTILIAILALFILARFPLLEGRAANLDVLSIYSDSFILYGYGTSIAFFVALYQVFKIIGLIGENKLFSMVAIQAIRSIRYCTIIFCVLLMLAGFYISVFHTKEEDPAGFLALCTVVTFVVIVMIVIVSIVEKILQNATDLKTENDLTV